MDKTQYICPGETHPISRAVHLWRLASHYAGCRDCPLRIDVGHLPPEPLIGLEGLPTKRERKSLFSDEGVRGIYLNELSRREAHQIAAALAGLLWDEKPLVGRSQAAQGIISQSAPTVLIGHDDRPAAPDLIVGVTAGLKRMGCQIVDVGLSTRPGFQFAADHLQVQAGIYVHGANCPPARIAMDFIAAGGRPISRQPLSKTHSNQLTLNRIESAMEEPCQRATRLAGSYRAFPASVPYDASLWRHFQNLKPLRICLCSGSRLVAKTLLKLFETLPGEVYFVPLPDRVRSLFDPNDADGIRCSKAVCDQQADIGILIDDDGRRCVFFDELGQLVSLTQTARLMAEVRQRDFPGDPIVIEESATAELELLLKRTGARVVRSGSTMANIWDDLRGHHGSFAGGASGRYWFREAYPACDAVIALACVMKAITRADCSPSQLV